MIAEPPLDAGAVKVTLACAFPAVAAPMVGAPGTCGGAASVVLVNVAVTPPMLRVVWTGVE